MCVTSNVVGRTSGVEQAVSELGVVWTGAEVKEAKAHRPGLMPGTNCTSSAKQKKNL